MVNHPQQGYGSHLAITIGINRYTLFQPLVYAQNDAQALWTFLVKEADIPIDRCLLITDTSSAVQGRSTCPIRDVIQDWVSRLSQQAKPGDTIWCFFSGYGVCYQGQDYLMPINGNPADIPGTGIAICSLFETLQTVSGVRVIVLLDMNRSQAMQVGVTVGSQALALAQQHGICLFLSCQPDEFSHESNGYGLFTTTLLEGLRHPQCHTPQALGRYLTINLPKLGNHYLLPSQHPIVAVPAIQSSQQLLPKAAQQTNPQVAQQGMTAQSRQVMNGHTTSHTSSHTTSHANSHATGAAPLPVSRAVAEKNGLLSLSGQISSQDLAEQAIANGYSQNGTRTAIAAPGSIQERSSHISHNGHLAIQWAQTTQSPASTTTSATASSDTLEKDRLAIFNLATPQNGYVHNGHAAPSTTPSTSSEVEPMNSTEKSSNTNQSGDGVLTPVEETDGKFWTNLLMWGGIALTVLLTGAFLRNVTGLFAAGGGKPSPTPSISPAPTTQPSNGMGLDVSALQPPVDPALIISFNALSSNQPDRALQLLDNLPPDRKQSQEYVTLRNQAQQRLSLMVLSDARVMITPNQASNLRQAIDHLQKIQPNDPLYEQARQDIDRWSLMILDIAEGRAGKGDYERAIAAAQLVPASSPAAHQQAQQLIPLWQKQSRQRRDSREILRQATAQAKGNQASAYNKAIRLVRQQIKPGDPLHQEAEQQVAAWSQRILTIARTRIDEGKLRQAMASLRMVPMNTAAYRDAQQETERLSQKILGLARSEASAGNYKQAIALAQLIPSGTSPYQEAQADLSLWRSNLP